MNKFEAKLWYYGDLQTGFFAHYCSVFRSFYDNPMIFLNLYWACFMKFLLFCCVFRSIMKKREITVKQKYNYFLWILISFFTGISNLRAEIDFKKLTMQDGLADNMVFYIHKDRYGYLWFGNNNGITRYDGNNIKNFRLSKEVRPITNIQETGNVFLSSG